MTEKLVSDYKVRGFSLLLVCFAFIFWRGMTFIRYIGVDFTFGALDCVRYIVDFIISRFVISRFCSIHFTVTLAGLKPVHSCHLLCILKEFELPLTLVLMLHLLAKA